MIVVAVLVSLGLIFFTASKANMAGEAINVLTEIRMGQVEDMNASDFDSQEFCAATVAKSGNEMAIFLYNCE